MKAIGTLIVAAGLLAVANAQDDQNKKKLEKLQGTWKILNAKIGGSDYPIKNLVAQTIAFSGDTITCKDIQGDTAKAVLDTAKTPAVVFCKDKKGKVAREFLYQVVGDTLKVTFYPTGTKPPADPFTKPTTDYAVLTYKREKK
jgi:uncharacterized protein (TIGR03067 family)